jgi:heterokaryon incompatibility protein Het-C
MALSKFTLSIMLICILLIFLPTPASAFGAGNIASIAKIEGSNFRHGDIEDMLQNIAFLHGRKWHSKMIKRVYFGNWLRDYSQAVDVGSLKGVQKDAIRIIVWVLCEALIHEVRIETNKNSFHGLWICYWRV